MAKQPPTSYTPMKPVDFIAEYVNPAIAAWAGDTKSKAMAICAISQIDILAEVVFERLRVDGRAPASSASNYRITLAAKAPAIGWTSDAHDAHKHGWLKEHSRQFSGGVVQMNTAGTAFFADDGFADIGFLGDTDTSLRRNDGSLVSIADVIGQTTAAWDAEFAGLGLPPWPTQVVRPG